MKKLLVSILLTLGGAAVFILGSPHYKIFVTNWNQTYYIILASSFLLITILLRRTKSLTIYAPATYAFFIASAALVFLKTGILNLPRDPSKPLQFLAIDKLSQFLHIVPVIFILTLLAKENLKSIFIQKGRLKGGLTFGVVSFICFAVAAFVTQPNFSALVSTLPTAIPWILLFIFSNAIMEELWFRAIFLRKFRALTGRRTAIIVTSLVFGASHINATYAFPGGGLVFGLVVFGLGVIGAYAMFKDDSLLGPVLFHAGYDLLIIIPVLDTV